MNKVNGLSELGSILATSLLEVPPFQRAYAWDVKPHVRDFLDDLTDHPTSKGSPYFLGTILLTTNGGDDSDRFKQEAVVDGQQRLTTACILVAVAIAQLSVLVEKSNLVADCNDIFIRSAVGSRRKFRTIQEDDSFFERFIIGKEDAREDDISTPSQWRLWDAKVFFRKALAERDVKAISALLQTLLKSQILVYSVATNAEATQIFELQNDRGKKLTDLEALKSFLMHGIYLHAGKDAERDLRVVQGDFAAIYRAAEQIEGHVDAPDEDQILSYHCIAFEKPPEGDIEGWRHPKELVKKIISSVEMREGLSSSEWIKRCSNRLKDSFTAALQILSARDNLEALGDFAALGRVAPFWPLLLKCWRADSSPRHESFAHAVRAMERFGFRSAIARRRSDAGESTLRGIAREFAQDFDDLVRKLAEMRNWWDIEVHYDQGLNTSNFFDYGHLATYLLWRYENHLRGKQGHQWPRLSWKTLVSPATDAERFSKDHIEPKYDDNPRLKQLVRWNSNDPGEPMKPFAEVFLHRLGNLVLDSISAGAAKGSGGFKGRIFHYTNSGMLSQGEIVSRFATKMPDKSLEWDDAAIRLRHSAMVEFAKLNW